MRRILWLGADLVDPEESFPALNGMRPAPEPILFSEATSDLIARRLSDVILVDGRGRPEQAAAMISKLRGDSEAPFLVILSSADLQHFDWASGASDFVTADSTGEELSARITKLVEPIPPDPSDVIRRGDVTINRERFEVRLRGEVVDLTFKEFELLQYLASRPGKVCSRSALLQEVWGYDFFGGTRTVDVHVRRLRAKLGLSADMIETVRNVGYRFAG